MRRRPKRLQVSTFPFLAVLLCAMGALILLLLVMDRRAKVTARLKAQQAYAEVLAARTKKLNERKDEWEEQRRAIHEALARQYQDLLGDVGKVQAQSASTQQSLQDQLLHLATCEQNVSQLKNALNQERSALLARRDQIGRVVEKDNIARVELEKLAREVAQLEQTLLAMQLMQKQDGNTYSLVPYKGRRGDSRQPVYIECTAANIILHPEHLVVSREDGVGIRRAVEERLGRMTTGKDGAKDAAYLLMLIRPNGIGSYYSAQGALQGLKLDFGYELIDAEWALDFGTEQKAGQPWRMARANQPDSGPSYATLSNRPITPYRTVDPHAGGPEIDPPGPPPVTGNRAPGTNGPASPGQVGPPGTSLSGLTGAGSPFVGGSPGSTSGGSSLPGQVGGLPSNVTGNSSGASGPGVWRGQTGESPASPPSHSAGLSSLGQPWGSTSQNGPATFGPLTAIGPAGNEPGIQSVARGTATLPGTSGPGQVGLASGPPGSGTPGVGSLYTFGQTGTLPGQSGTGATPSGPAADPRGSQSLTPRLDGNSAGNGPTPTANTSGANGPPVPGINVNTGMPSLTFGQRPAPSTAGSPQALPVSQKGSGQSGLGNLGPKAPGPAEPNGGDEPGSSFGTRPPIPYVDEKAKRPPPLPLMRTLGKKDYTIVVECFADNIMVFPGGKSFKVSDLPSHVDPQCVLVQTVQQLIARRQGTVREGDTPYRPVLRFQVHPDGRRSYFAAWPLLETMKLPMSREDVD